MVGIALIYLSPFIVCFTHVSNYIKKEQINSQLSYIVGLYLNFIRTLVFYLIGLGFATIICIILDVTKC